MKVNFNVALKDFGGTEVFENGVAIILKKLVVDALNITSEQDNPSGEEKMKRFLLAKKIYLSEDSVDITVEEATKIKELIGKHFAPIAVGNIFELLEQNT